MKNQVYSLKIGGMAGQGIKSAGLAFSKVAVRSGYSIFNYVEYPSLIRGGHNVMQTTFSVDPVYSPVQTVDFLIALNQETLDLHKGEVVANGGVIYEDEGALDASSFKGKCRLFPIPLRKLTKEVGGQEIVMNNVAVGAAIALMGGDLQHFLDLIAEEFAGKNPEITKINTSAAAAGFEYANKTFPNGYEHILAPQEKIEPQIVINGNEAVALGAIKAGIQFASIYPMSPASNILHVLAANQQKYGYVVKQVEDEISAINMAVGAAYGGARSMTSTSGGGFCLMTEGYGLAGMTETPVVIVEGMRPGPATGLPTWSEQGDLRFVLHAHQSEFPRIVLAPGDNEEAYQLTLIAFNLAEKYQTPVVILIDKNICEHDQSFPAFLSSSFAINRGKFVTELHPDYHRYELSPDGISPRTVPGKGNYFVTNSDEHNTFGYDSETIEDRNLQMGKRLQKLVTCAKEDMPLPSFYGPTDADITIVSWGSCKGSILEALKDYDNVNYLHINWISPFPIQTVRSILSNATYLLDIECNSTAQMAGLIREYTGIDILDKLLKNDGRPLFPEEIKTKINSILKR